MSEYQGDLRDQQIMDHKNGNGLNPMLSPEPKHKNAQWNPISSNLTDLSPFIQVYATRGTPDFYRHSTADMTLIETPATNTMKSSYLEQIDEGVKSISRIIIWTNDQCSEEIEGNGHGDSEYDSISSEVLCSGLAQIQENLFEGSDSISAQNCMEASQKMSMLRDRPKKNLLILPNGQEKPAQGSRRTCNCKKTQCLKLYCDCFRENRKCEGCSCVGCHNIQEFNEERSNAMAILTDRNPEAFRPKIESQSHTKGCNCKKSNCQKKYCECFQAGLACGSHCKCQDCKNCDHSKLKLGSRRFSKCIPPNFTLKSKIGPYVIVPVTQRIKNELTPIEK